MAGVEMSRGRSCSAYLMSALSPGRHLLGDTFNIGPNHPDVAVSLNVLTNLYCEEGTMLRRNHDSCALSAIDETTFGPNHPEVARALNNLAVMYGNKGRYAEKEHLLGPNSVQSQKCLWTVRHPFGVV
jgi:hypothetical protein